MKEYVGFEGAPTGPYAPLREVPSAHRMKEYVGFEGTKHLCRGPVPMTGAHRMKEYVGFEGLVRHRRHPPATEGSQDERVRGV